ncbi:MAG: hypothetical protein LBR74_01945 [Eubacterium sp.]|jgi:hypothetical protein|nr:hypothetical protein [Eubacterium sp.]
MREKPKKTGKSSPHPRKDIILPGKSGLDNTTGYDLTAFNRLGDDAEFCKKESEKFRT